MLTDAYASVSFCFFLNSSIFKSKLHFQIKTSFQIKPTQNSSSSTILLQIMTGKRKNRSGRGSTSAPPPPLSPPPQDDPVVQEEVQEEVNEDDLPILGPMARYFENLDDIVAVRKYRKLYKRILFPTRPINFPDFVEPGWGVPQLFGLHHFTLLLTCAKPHYPDLVRMFYSTLKWDPYQSSRLVAVVKNTQIFITEGLLRRLFDLEQVGTRYFCLGEYPTYYEGDHEADKQFAWHPNVPNVKKSVILPLRSRLLLKVLNYTFIPKWAHKDEVSFLEIMTMAHMLTPEPVRRLDAAFIMLHIMEWYSAAEGNVHLPYGSYLTAIFEHFHVDLMNENVVPSSILDKKVVTNMGIRRDPQQRFVLASSLPTPRRAPADDASSSQPPSSSGTAQTSVSSLEFQQLMSAINNVSLQCTELQSQNIELKSTIAPLTTRLAASEDYNRDQFTSIHAKLDSSTGADNTTFWTDLVSSMDADVEVDRNVGNTGGGGNDGDGDDDAVA